MPTITINLNRKAYGPPRPNRLRGQGGYSRDGEWIRPVKQTRRNLRKLWRRSLRKQDRMMRRAARHFAIGFAAAEDQAAFEAFIGKDQP